MIRITFHNLQNYGSHSFMKELSKTCNKEKIKIQNAFLKKKNIIVIKQKKEFYLFIIFFPTLVRVFLCPFVGPFPLVGPMLIWFTWGRKLALDITL